MALPFLCSVVAAGVSPAAVLPAGMAFAVTVMVAFYIRVELKLALEESFHGPVGAPADASV